MNAVFSPTLLPFESSVLILGICDLLLEVRARRFPSTVTGRGCPGTDGRSWGAAWPGQAAGVGGSF